MKLKNTLVAATLLASCLMPNHAFMAARNIWAEVNTSNTYTITQPHKVIVLPIFKNNTFNNAISGNEAKFNQYLLKHLQDKVKSSQFTSTAPALAATANYSDMLNTSLSQSARGELAANHGADAYIIANVKHSGTKTDSFPATTVQVTAKSYDKIKNGPHGDETLNYRSWTTNHTTAPTSKTLRQVSIDFDVYNTNGQKIFTMTEDYHVYDVNEEHAYKQLINRFVDSWAGLKPAKTAGNGKKLQVKPLNLNVNISDNHSRAAQFAYSEGPKHLKNFRVLNANSAENPDYYITGTLTEYKNVQTYHKPYASATDKLIHTDYRDYYGKDGKKKRMTIERYETRFTDHAGSYDYETNVSFNLSLVHAGSGNVIASQTLSEKGETPAEAMHKIFRKFYKEIDKLGK